MRTPRSFFAIAAALLAGWSGAAAAETPAPRLPTISGSAIHAGCKTFDSRTCQIVVEPFTINIASGEKLSLFQIAVDGLVVYDWRPDQTNPAPSFGTTYTPSRVAFGFGVRCSMNHTVSLLGRDTGDSGTIILGVTSPISCPTPDPRLTYYTVAPCRQLDTRSSSPMASHETRTAPLTGAPCGIPAGAAAVSVNLAETQAAGQGHLRIYPGDGSLPQTSSLNFVAGQTRSSNAILKLSSDGTGSVAIFNGSSGTVHVIIDVNGYFQ